jgi:hypothetical protein
MKGMVMMKISKVVVDYGKRDVSAALIIGDGMTEIQMPLTVRMEYGDVAKALETLEKILLGHAKQWIGRATKDDI